ncbi:hypothetical protein M422DRAFT_22773 [Sphaerobolus stellatus SS14]|nr:hypothetical protein M422DRAFT_22773 [Sphaerobolus stellatus SS14]
MPWSYRNARYLRISAHTVLPLYIYLDERHIDWMTDYTLQKVLEDLRPHIGPKLRLETDPVTSRKGAASKKGEVEVHRGDTYQFAYWFRKNEPHAVLIKERHFVQHQAPKESTTEERAIDASADPASGEVPSRKRKRGKEPEKQAAEPQLQPSTATPRRSRRAKVIASRYREADSDEEARDDDEEYNEEDEEQESQQVPDSPPDFSMAIDKDDEFEEKPKLTMQLTYQGFTICDRCLCLVIQPWPIVRTSRASTVPRDARTPSMAPPDLRERTPAPLRRERTPLFLPDLDDRRSVTPAPLPSRVLRNLPRVPLFHEDPDEDDDVGGGDDEGSEEDERDMMSMSQALTAFRDERAGSADEDENEGDVFLGDADERK